MATESQRSYQAPCPGCGAPVEFRSAQSAFAVCPYCQSTVVRNGETLTRVGKMAELFEDFSPLQLMASGKFEQRPFTLVGRLQYQYPEGRWTEWAAMLDDGSVATLAEDNGAYVFTWPMPAAGGIPAAENFRVGATTQIQGKTFTVASNQPVTLVSAQGELAHLPALGTPFAMVELRNDSGEVLSIDYGSNPPALSLGRAVALDDLQLTGLRDASPKEEKARGFSCPNCGASVEVTLDSTKSITCRACNSLIDMSEGIGGELRHATQDEPVRQLIPLGSIGQLQNVAWQVVGFQHRLGTDPSDADEHFGWSEYLLYNKKRGFVFLVDAEDGWSLVKPVTGAPKMASSNATSVVHLGVRYTLKERYTAKTTYVAGEFYWRVERGQTTDNRDFANAQNILSLEQTPKELIWSFGGKIDGDAVAKAFKLEDKKDLLKRSDASPLSTVPKIGCLTIIIIIVVILILLALLSTCSSSGSSSGSSYGSSRSSGGSFGGSSSGGGHK